MEYFSSFVFFFVLLQHKKQIKEVLNFRYHSFGGPSNYFWN